MLGWIRNVCFASLILVLFACGGSGSTGGGTAAIHGALVASGFDQPMLYLADPSDATRAYVIERPGRIKLLVNDVVQSTDVLDITSTVDTSGECGLLGMAFDPNFSSNHFVYLHYNAGSPIETRIVRYTMNVGGTSAGSGTPVFSFVQASTTNHKGGAINFGSDGYLYLATGDGGGGNDPNNFAQDPTSFLGKVLRIDVATDDFPSDLNQNYGVPADNPWVGTAGVNPEIWDFGMRNPFRWTIDSVTGGLLIADVGQDAFEEVNYEPAGHGHRNYGWANREGLHDAGTGNTPFFTPLTNPFLEYSHGFGSTVIGGFIYRGTALGATLQNRYFFGDYITHKIASVPFSTSGGEAVLTSMNSAVDHTSAINTTLGSDDLSGPVSITPDHNGEIMVVDLNKGTLLRLVP